MEGSEKGAESPDKDILSKKEEFFQVLNLLATKRVKVRYCRTIKERLRATTKEESLSLPSTSRPVPRIGPSSSPLRRKPEGEEESPRVNKPLIRGGINVLKSIKKRKSDRLKRIPPEPSTKSLLSYLQPKSPTSDVEDSSSLESDTDTGSDSFRIKEMSVSVNRLSNRHLVNHRMQASPRLSRSSETVWSLDPDVLRSPEPSAGRQMAAGVHSPEDQKICGFSNEISPKTFSKNEQLKNIISDLESEITEKEKENRNDFLAQVLSEAYDDLESEPKMLYPQPLEVSNEHKIRMQLLADFNIASETEDTDTDEDLSNPTHHHTGVTSLVALGRPVTDSDSSVTMSDGSRVGTRKASTDIGMVVSDVKAAFADLSTDSSIATTVKAEMDEDEVVEYTELSATDLLRTPKAEYVAESDILEHLKQLRLAAVDRHHGAVGIISTEELDVKPSPEQLATANNSQKTSSAVSLREDKSGSIEKDGPRHQEKQQQQHLQQEGCRYDAALIEELLDGSTDLSDQETKSFTTNPYPNLASLTNTTVNMETNTEGQSSLDKDDGDASIVLESIKLPGKKVKGKYKDLFIKKQLQLLANVRQTDSLVTTADSLVTTTDSLATTADSLTAVATSQDSSTTDEAVPNKKRLISKKALKIKRLKKQVEKQTRKMRLMNRRRKLRIAGSDDKAELKPPKRRYSTEVDKLVDGGQLLLPKIYRQIILSGRRSPQPAIEPNTEEIMYEFTELDRDNRDLTDILKEKDKGKNDRKRRGDPTFVIPFRSGDARLDELVNRTRQILWIASRRTKFLESSVHIVSKHSYWSDKEEDKSTTKDYSTNILGVDQISKATRKSKQFSRLARPPLEDVLRARRILGIQGEQFNYEPEEDDTEEEKEFVSRKKRRRFAKEKGGEGRKDSSTLSKQRLKDPDPRGYEATSAGEEDEFNIDNIESLVDNQPVDDSNDSEEESAEDARSETSPKFSGRFACGACGSVFPSRQGLDLHEKKQLTCKPFSCKLCDKRFRSHKLCMRHEAQHGGETGSAATAPGEAKPVLADKQGFAVRYSCDQCPEIFNEESAFIRHRDTEHPATKSYKCNMKNCGKKFGKKLSLDAHVSKHMRVLPWKCGKCNSRFLDRYSLKRHITNVHEMQNKMRQQYNMINVSKETEGEEGLDLESMLVFDDEDAEYPVNQVKSVTKILASSGDQLPEGEESSGLLAAVVAPHQPLVPCQPLLDAHHEDMDDDVFDNAEPDEVQDDEEAGDGEGEGFPSLSSDIVEAPAIVQALQAANADLDVEVELVDDIAAILQQQNQPSILKYPSTQHIPENQELLLLRQSEQSLDLNDSVGENIEKIEDFLKADPDLDSEEDEGPALSPPSTTNSAHQEQQQSENIGDIAKFLEMDNPDSDLEDEEEDFRGFSVPVQQPVEKKDGGKFKIPRSPSFKRRLADKQIVSIKGLDLVPRKTKAKTTTGEEGSKKKKAKISFEEQLKQADTTERVAKKESGSSSKKSKKGKGLKDFMITKKYAKLKPTVKVVENKAATNSRKDDISKPHENREIKVKQQQQQIKTGSSNVKTVSPVTKSKPSGEGESSKTKRPISGSDGLKPSKSSTTMIATPSKQHVKTPSKAKPDPKPQPAAIVRSNAASNDGIEFIKLSKPDRPIAQTSGSKSTPAKHVKSRDPRLSQPSQDLTKAQSVLPQQHSVPSGPIRRLPGPSPDKIRPNTASRSARPDKNSGGFRPLIEGKRAVMPPPIRKSVSAPTKKLSQDTVLAPAVVKTAVTELPEIDFERIIREPGRPVGLKHIRPSRSAEKPSLGSITTQNNLKQVLSSVSPPTAAEREETDPRPRDPRLHHSSKLKPSTQPNMESKGKPSVDPKTTSVVEGKGKSEPEQAVNQNVKPVREAVRCGMGLPAPVPAASLSSEDESSVRSDQDSPPLTNKSLESSVLNTASVIVSGRSKQPEGKGYYTNHYKTEETKKSVAAAVRAAAAPVFSTPKIVAPIFSSAPLYPALSKSESAPAALVAAVSSSSSMAVAATSLSSTASVSSAAPPSFGAALISQAALASLVQHNKATAAAVAVSEQVQVTQSATSSSYPTSSVISQSRAVSAAPTNQSRASSVIFNQSRASISSSSQLVVSLASSYSTPVFSTAASSAFLPATSAGGPGSVSTQLPSNFPTFDGRTDLGNQTSKLAINQSIPAAVSGVIPLGAASRQPTYSKPGSTLIQAEKPLAVLEL